PNSCREFQTLLKATAKQNRDQEWKQSTHFFGGKTQEKFIYIPLVLDTDTEKNKLHNKIIFKSKKSKKPRSKKMRSYIPKDTLRKSPEDLLDSQEKSILLVGKPGIGKTTAVRQMLYLWAERQDKDLDFMFYLDKNTLMNIPATPNLENLLLDTFVMQHPHIREKAGEITQYFQEYSEKVTIIFDGISDFDDNSLLLGIIEQKVLPEAKIVVTCRPETEDDFFDWPTCKVYVQGFNEESIYDYFTQMPDPDPDLVTSVVSNPALFSLCHVPMYAFMVATCFSFYTSEGARGQCTATELYIRIFRHCVQRHGNKKLRHLDGHIKGCRDSVLVLAETAFSATKSKTINMEFDCSDSCIAGIFLRSLSVTSPGFAKTYCAFLHNTIQEFFSALWLLEKPEHLDEVLQLCQTEESKHLKYLIPFLCGLQSETSIPLLKCLFPPNKLKGTFDGFFEMILNTFLQDQTDGGYSADVAFICQCLFEFQSSEACFLFLERVEYNLDLRDEHLDPHQCCAVSYVISQSRERPVHLDLENSVITFSGLKTLLRHTQTLRDLSTTLCQVWKASLKCEQQSYLINLLKLCENEIHLPVSIQKGLLQQAGEIITQSAEQIILHVHCDRDLHQQLRDGLCRTISTWLPFISSLHFIPKWTQGESSQHGEKRVRSYKLDLCLQAALNQKANVQTAVKTVISHGRDEEVDFLLDLYSHVKQYETETGRNVLPALLPVYRSAPAEWIIDLSEREPSLLLEVLKLQPVQKPVVLRGWTDDNYEIWNVLQCLPYISQLSFIPKQNQRDSCEEWEKKVRSFKVNLCLQADFYQIENVQTTVKKIMPCKSDHQSEFLLDLYSHVKQYETETGRNVLPALLPVYQSAPAEWIIDLSERKASLLLEVLKQQPGQKPVELRGCSDEESEVRSFLQCLPYISQLRISVLYEASSDLYACQNIVMFSFSLYTQEGFRFLVSLFHEAAESGRWTGEKTLELLTSVCTYSSFPYEDTGSYRQSKFLLDLYSHVKQYETETGRNVLPALLPVYRSAPAEWIIDLSERKASLLLEVLKLQPVKKPVELRGCSDEESKVRSFLQCLPYISQLRFSSLYTREGFKFLVSLFHEAAESERRTGEKTLELLTSVCTYSSFPYRYTDSYIQSKFLLDLYSHVKQYETETGRNVLPALLPVYRSAPAEWIIDLSETELSLLLEVLKLQPVKKPVELWDWSDEESEVRSFLQCLPYISQLRFFINDDTDEVAMFLVSLFHEAVESERRTGEKTLELLASVCTYSSFPYEDTDSYRQSKVLLDLYSHVKQYETETGRNVLPALLPVYRSAPAEWIIDLSERKASLLLEVLKLQPVKKPVELRGCSDEESEVRSVLQCLPYISQLRFFINDDTDEVARFLVSLFHEAAESERQTGEKTLELLASVCTYSSFPYEDTDSYRQSEFLLDLYSHVKQYATETGRNVLPALLPVYRSSPAEWIIDLSERKASLLLEVLRLQPVQKPVELRGWSDEESEVRRFLQCLPYISQLRYAESLVPYLSELVVSLAEETELVKALLAAMKFTFTVNGVLSSKKCRAVERVLDLTSSQLNLTLDPKAISLRGASLLFRHITHLHKLCLNECVVKRMAQAFQAHRARVPLVIEELSVRVQSAQKLSRVLSSLASLLNCWTVQCLNLTECEMEAHSLNGLMCHPGHLTIRLSKESLQQFADLVYEVKDKKLTCFFLEKMGGDMTSCSLSWEELIYFVQQGVCRIRVNVMKSRITYKQIRQLMSLLAGVHFKRLSSNVVLLIIREIYETRSADCVSSLLSSIENRINLNGRELDSVHCAALRFTLQHCTAVSLSLLWTSLPEGELESILPLFSRVSHLSADRLLLLKLLHCCSVTELQESPVAAVLSALQNRLDFSCRIGLDLTAQTQDNILHLTAEDCTVISTVILNAQKHTELILEDCEIQDAGVDVLFSALHMVRLRCTKALLLQFLALVHVRTDFRAVALCQALEGEMDLSGTQLNQQACRSLALFLEHTEGLSELDLSHCQLSDHCLELHKIDVL
ncbi:hypothetical protein NFI96_017916, partial [Prochilodus magdalenae]